MNIFTRELKATRKSMIIWCFGVIAMVVGGMGKYAGLANSPASLTEFMNSLPESLLNLMGMSSLDITTAMGFYGVLFLYIAIMLGIHAIMLGANIIAKEEIDKTSEFLMVKPVSRKTVLTMKLLAGLVNLTILNVISFFSSFVMVNYFSKNTSLTHDMLLLTLGLFILQLIFMSVGSLMATIKKHSKSVGAAATGVLLISFLLSMIINMNENLDILKCITPFKYFEATAIINGNGFELPFFLLSFVLISLCLIGTYYFYEKRDLNI